MYNELRKYLVLYRELPIPGLGLISMERQPASIDFASRQILPPSFQVEFREGQVQPSRRLYTWLAYGLGITERDAIMQFNSFVFDLKEKLNRGESLEWLGVGNLSKGLGGVIEFRPAFDQLAEGEPVHADKVLREHADHLVRVGEDERTSAQMREYFQADPAKRNIKWAVALVLLLISFILTGLYLSSRGLKPASSGSHQKIKLDSTPANPQYLK